MDKVEAYKLMLTIRYFEEAIERLFLEGRIMGTAHTCIGQEGIAVGTAAALQPQDAMTTTHRGHGHFIARGADPGRAMAELFGRATGYSRGRGGSQMMMDTSIGFFGSNGITGGSIPFATGVALDALLRKTGRVTVCFFGDGAFNQGVLHESINIAALWKLPVLYLVENNGYAMSTATTRGLSNPKIVDHACAYKIRGERIDGNDFLTVHGKVAELVDHLRAGHGPALLECVTYRLSGHSRGDARVYRTREEEAAAWQNDPIVRMESHLRETDQWDETMLAATRREITERITTAIEFAENSPLSDPTNLTADLFAPDHH